MDASTKSFFAKISALKEDAQEIHFDANLDSEILANGSAKPLLYYDKGIFCSVGDGAKVNSLETVDYDALHSVNIANSLHLATKYLEFVPDRRHSGLEVLEIGSGTGFLTLGLSNNPRINLCVSTDISLNFLRITQSRLTEISNSRVILFCADLNELPFSPESFDAILGNSILHHIFAFEDLLSKFWTILRPGGQIVMSEPCQQGKSFVSFFLSAILKLDRSQSSPLFSRRDGEMIEAILSIHKREIRASENQELKRVWEDKHIFDTGRLRSLSQNLGFSSFRSVNTGIIKDGFLSECESVLRIMGVNQSLKQYDFLFDSFQEEYMPFFASDVQSPHQFLVFTK